MIPRPADLVRARERLHGMTIRTPLLELAIGDESLPRVLLKLENLQRTRSFKPRGALNASFAAREQGTFPGLITFSSGNHGQAVALAAKELGVEALVVAPEDVRSLKLAGMEALGARVVRHGLTSAERMARAGELAAETGYLLVPPYDHPDVIAGQSTVAQEILEQADGIDAVIVPVGGGGLISGTALALDGRARVIGAEPADADDARRSLASGDLVRNEQASSSSCDGLRNTCLGEIPWSIIRRRVDDIVAVSEEDVARALKLLHEAGVAPVEPSAAAALAAILSGRAGRPGELVVAIVSGGNAS